MEVDIGTGMDSKERTSFRNDMPYSNNLNLENII